MRLSQKQKNVVAALRKGGFIWKAASQYYLARKIGEGFQSEPIHSKTALALIDINVIRADSEPTKLGKEKWSLVHVEKENIGRNAGSPVTPSQVPAKKSPKRIMFKLRKPQSPA